MWIVTVQFVDTNSEMLTVPYQAPSKGAAKILENAFRIYGRSGSREEIRHVSEPFQLDLA